MRVVILAMLALAGLAVPAAKAQQVAPVVRAVDARLAGDDKRTRLIVDLSAPVPFRAFVLADPYRIVIDLPMLDYAIRPEAGRQGRGLVSAFRFGSISAAKSRIVLDLTGPATLEKAFLLDPVDDQPARLVLDLVKSDRAGFLAALAAQQKVTAPPAAGTPGDPAPAPVVVPTPGPAAPDAPGPKLPVVMLDPGHGGIDSGAVSSRGEQEKSIVLDFARMLAAKIDASGRYHAVLTRSDDSFVTLSGRIEAARTSHAALFISIHADTLADPFGVRGATIYTLSDTASDADAARTAEKENRADAIAGVDLSAEPDDVADILIDLTRRETKGFSNQFAKVLTQELKAAATLNKNPHRSAGFRVLKASDIPSVLLELGYLSNPKDAKLLTSDGWRNDVTDRILASIDVFFAARARDARTTSN